jgi:hypothetical protein
MQLLRGLVVGGQALGQRGIGAGHQRLEGGA